MAYANKINGTITKFNTLPFGWVGVENVDCYYETRTDLHEIDGFYPIVDPLIGKYQEKGKLYFDKPINAYTYQVIDMTEEQILSEIEEESNALKKDQYAELFPTDWYYVRKADTGEEVPLDIQEDRQEIRDRYGTQLKDLEKIKKNKKIK